MIEFFSLYYASLHKVRKKKFEVKNEKKKEHTPKKCITELKKKRRKETGDLWQNVENANNVSRSNRFE